MANTGAIKAGRAYVEIFVDKNPLIRGLRRREISARMGRSRIFYGPKDDAGRYFNCRRTCSALLLRQRRWVMISRKCH